MARAVCTGLPPKLEVMFASLLRRATTHADKLAICELREQVEIVLAKASFRGN